MVQRRPDTMPSMPPARPTEVGAHSTMQISPAKRVSLGIGRSSGPGPSALLFLEVESTAVHAEPHPARLSGTVWEDMAEMAVAASALHFRAHHAVGAILDHLHRAGSASVKPAIPCRFNVAGEERIAAAGATVRAVVLGIEVRPAERPLGAVLAQHRVLLWCQSLPPLFVGRGNVCTSVMVSSNQEGALPHNRS